MQADHEIERLVGELRTRGEWERTVLILLSDHSMDTTVAIELIPESMLDMAAASIAARIAPPNPGGIRCTAKVGNTRSRCWTFDTSNPRSCPTSRFA